MVSLMSQLNKGPSHPPFGNIRAHGTVSPEDRDTEWYCVCPPPAEGLEGLSIPGARHGGSSSFAWSNGNEQSTCNHWNQCLALGAKRSLSKCHLP